MSDETTIDPGNGDGKNGKVLSLIPKEKKRKKNIDSGDPLPKAEAYHWIAMAIDRHEMSTLPEFPVRFYGVEVGKGIKKVLMEGEEGVVSYVSLDYVAQVIHNYLDLIRSRPDFCFETKHSDAAARDWLYRTKPIPEPQSIAWQGETCLTFRRLPWKYEPDYSGEKTPLFNELFSRMSNKEAVMDWIGSLFFPEADRQQYVWLYGEGRNGKGSLAYFLGQVFGQAYRAVLTPGGDKHWTAGLVGTRLVVFPDCNNYSFPTTGLFKLLTGEDKVPINEKFQPAYSTDLHSKFMFLSNEKPALSSGESDLRRAIYAEVLPLKKDTIVDGRYRKALWEEGGAFLATCIHNYRIRYPHHGPIRVDSAVLDDVVEENEERFATIVERAFDFSSPTFRCPASEFQEVLMEHFAHERERREFRAYLKRKYLIKNSTPVRISGTLCKVYLGFKRTRDWRAQSAFTSRIDD